MANAFDSLLKMLGFHPDNLHKDVLESVSPSVLTYDSTHEVVVSAIANPGTSILSARVTEGEGSLAWKRHPLGVREQEKVIDYATLLRHNQTTGK